MLIAVSRVIALGLLLVSTWALAEKKIYACKDEAGNAIFSSQPCGPDAKELHIDAGRAISSTPVDGTAQQPQQAQPNSDGAPPQSAQPPSDAIQDISDSVADSTCRSDAKRLGVRPSEDHLQELEAQRTALIKNLAGTPASADSEAQSRGLDFQIEEERRRIDVAAQKADHDVHEALAECDRRKTDREQHKSGGQ